MEPVDQTDGPPSAVETTCARRYVVREDALGQADREALTARLPVFVVKPGASRPTRDHRELRLWRREPSCLDDDGPEVAYASVPRAWGLRRFGAPGLDARVEPRALADAARAWAGPPLRPHQVEAAKATRGRDDCTLSMSCGAGKTVTALHLASQEWRCRFVVLVHTQALQNQWLAEVARCLPGARVGALGGTRKAKKDGGKREEEARLGVHDVVVAMVQSVARRAWPVEAREALSEYAMLVDECHHTPATTYASAVELSACRRRLGLSATPRRADSLDMRMWLGPIVYEYSRPQRVAFEQPLAPRMDGDHRGASPGASAVERVNALAASRARTAWVAGLVRAQVGLGRGRVLVLAQRVGILEELLGLVGGAAAVVSGRTRPAERERALREANPVLASLQVAKEGLDMADCTALVYALPPGVDSGLIAQTVGRVTRTPDACARVVDPADPYPPVLVAQTLKRRRMWIDAGYTWAGGGAPADDGDEEGLPLFCFGKS